MEVELNQLEQTMNTACKALEDEKQKKLEIENNIKAELARLGQQIDEARQVGQEEKQSALKALEDRLNVRCLCPLTQTDAHFVTSGGME